METVEEYNAYNTALAKLVKKLKKATGAKTIAQNYRGTGKQQAVRQLWITWAPGLCMDVWLYPGRVVFGGIVCNGGGWKPAPLKCLATPEETYAEIETVITAWLPEAA